MYPDKPYTIGPAKASYQNIGQCNLNTIYRLQAFSHEIVDREGFSLRRFYSYRDAKEYVYNKPDYKVQKIKIDLTKIEECLF
jgi:hypothetical protein